MFFPKLNVGAGLAAATIAASMLVATPSQATITSFASYSAVNSSSNIYWKNSASDGASSKSGTLFTSSTNGSTAGSTTIKFSFLQPGLNVVSNVTATFTLLATVTNVAASSLGPQQTQKGLTGSFSIISTAPITISGYTYAAGTNLLSATFTNASINGTSSGGVRDATSGANAGTITYTSAFLNFLPTVDKDFSLSLTSITPSLAHSTGNALKTFRANSTGTFSTDPVPAIVIPVPEAATWAMFIAGFGLMGATLRRRRPEHSLV
ncbi:PEPxxWA-CTERM sorting domain-containing protein [Sphingomonas sp. MMS24-J13]|uniref:PEPxxWA-CTERM sorting domain-containing protein n=1 Tax=Sphingomonas sp. MMS24-J13 TaxID=3238686 RepID=UPI00384BE062